MKNSNFLFLLLLCFCLLFFTSPLLKAQAPNCLWAKSIGGVSYDRGGAMIKDSAGNIYTTGYFTGTVDFDPGPDTFNLTSYMGYDIFILKLDASGSFLWAKALRSSYVINISSIVVDTSGNIYATGNFLDSIDFDPGLGVYNLVTYKYGGYATFYLKLDANGNFVWVNDIGGGIGGSITSNSLAIDKKGNIYSAGYFFSSGSCDFDPGSGVFNLISDQTNSQPNIFILKLDNLGNFLWANAIGNSAESMGNSLILDSSNNIYITGFFAGTVDFDPGAGTYNLTGNGYQDIYISKYNSSGNFIWAKKMVGTGNYTQPSSIALDIYNNVYTTGAFGGTTDFDPGSGVFNLTSVDWSDIFISKLDSLGNFVWAKAIGSSSQDGGSSITTDKFGNVYTIGAFGGTVDFDPSSSISNLTATGSFDAFVSKLDSSGNFVWVKSILGSNWTNGSSIFLDKSNDIYISGNFQGSADFGSVNLICNDSSTNGGDIFIAKLANPTITTGIENKENGISVFVFPNPNNGKFQIKIIDSNFKANRNRLEIYNVQGEKIYQSILSTSNVEVNLNTHSSGIYFYKIQNEKEIIKTGKFIIE